MKAAQALSGIIHLDRLITTLMQVAIENAGAETGKRCQYQPNLLCEFIQTGNGDFAPSIRHSTARGTGENNAD